MTSQSSIKESRTVISSSSSSSRGGGMSGMAGMSGMSSSSGAGGSTSHMELAGGGSADSDFYYKSNIHPRSTSVQRASMGMGMGGGMSGGSSYKRTVEISSGHVPGYSTMSSGRVTDVKNHREQEKKDMRDLNERFANYIEKVRFLEAQNRKLAGELDDLKGKWGKETSAIKVMFETELKEARDLLDDTNKEKNKLEVRVQTMQDQTNDVLKQLDDAKKWRAQDRDVINKLNQQISELEAELRMLRRTNDSLDTERQRDKATIARLNEDLEKLRIDLSNETIQRLDAENRAQTLAEEMEFMKSVHEQELKELAGLAYRDTTAENREFWKNELSQAIRDIQSEYDSKLDHIRGEMETFYNLKVQEFRTGATKQNMEVTHSREETKKVHKMLNDCKIRMADVEARNAMLEKQYQDLLREMEQKDQEHTLEVNQLKDEMNKLRAEMESMLVELQTLMDAKLSLELEIAAYRKLLETEESRVRLPQRRGQPRPVTSLPEHPAAKPPAIDHDSKSPKTSPLDPREPPPPPAAAKEDEIQAHDQSNVESLPQSQGKEVVEETVVPAQKISVEGAPGVETENKQEGKGQSPQREVVEETLVQAKQAAVEETPKKEENIPESKVVESEAEMPSTLEVAEKQPEVGSSPGIAEKTVIQTTVEGEKEGETPDQAESTPQTKDTAEDDGAAEGTGTSEVADLTDKESNARPQTPKSLIREVVEEALVSMKEDMVEESLGGEESESGDGSMVEGKLDAVEKGQRGTGEVVKEVPVSSAGGVVAQHPDKESVAEGADKLDRSKEGPEEQVTGEEKGSKDRVEDADSDKTGQEAVEEVMVATKVEKKESAAPVAETPEKGISETDKDKKEAPEVAEEVMVATTVEKKEEKGEPTKEVSEEKPQETQEEHAADQNLAGTSTVEDGNEDAITKGSDLPDTVVDEKKGAEKGAEKSIVSPVSPSSGFKEQTMKLEVVAHSPDNHIVIEETVEQSMVIKTEAPLSLNGKDGAGASLADTIAEEKAEGVAEQKNVQEKAVVVETTSEAPAVGAGDVGRKEDDENEDMKNANNTKGEKVEETTAKPDATHEADDVGEKKMTEEETKKEDKLTAEAGVMKAEADQAMPSPKTDTTVEDTVTEIGKEESKTEPSAVEEAETGGTEKTDGNVQSKSIASDNTEIQQVKGVEVQSESEKEKDAKIPEVTAAKETVQTAVAAEVSESQTTRSKSGGKDAVDAVDTGDAGSEEASVTKVEEQGQVTELHEVTETEARKTEEKAAELVEETVKQSKAKFAEEIVQQTEPEPTSEIVKQTEPKDVKETVKEAVPEVAKETVKQKELEIGETSATGTTTHTDGHSEDIVTRQEVEKSPSSEAKNAQEKKPDDEEKKQDDAAKDIQKSTPAGNEGDDKTEKITDKQLKEENEKEIVSAGKSEGSEIKDDENQKENIQAQQADVEMKAGKEESRKSEKDENIKAEEENLKSGKENKMEEKQENREKEKYENETEKGDKETEKEDNDTEKEDKDTEKDKDISTEKDEGKKLEKDETVSKAEKPQDVQEKKEDKETEKNDSPKKGEMKSPETKDSKTDQDVKEALQTEINETEKDEQKECEKEMKEKDEETEKEEEKTGIDKKEVKDAETEIRKTDVDNQPTNRDQEAEFKDTTEDTVTEKKEDKPGTEDDKGNNTEEDFDEIEDTTQEMEDVKETSSDVKKEDVKETSSDMKKEDVKETSSDMKKEDVKETSSDMKKEDVKETSSDMKKEDVKETSSDMKREDGGEEKGNAEDGMKESAETKDNLTESGKKEQGQSEGPLVEVVEEFITPTIIQKSEPPPATEDQKEANSTSDDKREDKTETRVSKEAAGSETHQDTQVKAKEDEETGKTTPGKDEAGKCQDAPAVSEKDRQEEESRPKTEAAGVSGKACEQITDQQAGEQKETKEADIHHLEKVEGSKGQTEVKHVDEGKATADQVDNGFDADKDDDIVEMKFDFQEYQSEKKGGRAVAMPEVDSQSDKALKHSEETKVESPRKGSPVPSKAVDEEGSKQSKLHTDDKTLPTHKVDGHVSAPVDRAATNVQSDSDDHQKQKNAGTENTPHSNGVDMSENRVVSK